LTRTLAAELGPHGIRVNAIAPGIVETERLKRLDPSMGIGTPEQLAAIALRRFGQTEDLANVLEFLTTDLSSYVTGQVLSVCGGAVLHPH
jgi:3-oxoacyl-[acyl-carrier protein] reductase